MLNYLVRNAQYIGDYRVWIVFADGKKGEINLKKIIKSSKGEVFEPLHDVNYFKKFKIAGSTLSWENEADIAPETLYELLTKQSKNK